MSELETTRQAIDAIDAQLVNLLEQRNECVQKIGAYKALKNLPIRDHSRELAHLKQIEQWVNRKSQVAAITEIFQLIMQQSRASQALSQPVIKIGISGPTGSYAECAARSYFSEETHEMSYCESFEQACQQLQLKRVDYAVLPIENTTTGGIHDIYDLLIQHKLYICGEVCLPIRHALMGRPNLALADIERVYSHPQGLAQCAHLLKTLTQVTLVPTNSTAQALQLVSQMKTQSVAAIGNPEASEVYQLAILQKEVQDDSANTTRFVVLTRKCHVSETANTVSIVTSMPHRPGALHRLLGEFSTRDINLLRIESRPIQGQPWHYYMYLDIEGHLLKTAVKEALTAVKNQTDYYQFLGSFKRGTQ